jgi:hypothetical protein
MQSASLYNSFFNVSEALGQTVQLDWPSGTSDWISSGPILIEPGFYSASAMNSKLQQIMYDHKMYTENASNGKILYYLSLGTSTTQYANYITSQAVQTDATIPAGAAWSAVTTPRSPRVYFGKLGPLYGFPSDSTLTTHYGYTTATSETFYSVQTPQVNQWTTVVMRSNIVHNTGLSYPSDFLYALALNSAFGDLTVSPQHEPLYNSINQNGTYSELTIRLCNNSLAPITLTDTNVLFVLSIIKQ